MFYSSTSQKHLTKAQERNALKHQEYRDNNETQMIRFNNNKLGDMYKKELKTNIGSLKTTLSNTTYLFKVTEEMKKKATSQNINEISYGDAKISTKTTKKKSKKIQKATVEAYHKFKQKINPTKTELPKTEKFRKHKNTWHYIKYKIRNKRKNKECKCNCNRKPHISEIKLKNK